MAKRSSNQFKNKGMKNVIKIGIYYIEKGGKENIG